MWREGHTYSVKWNEIVNKQRTWRSIWLCLHGYAHACCVRFISPLVDSVISVDGDGVGLSHFYFIFATQMEWLSVASRHKNKNKNKNGATREAFVLSTLILTSSSMVFIHTTHTHTYSHRHRQIAQIEYIECSSSHEIGKIIDIRAAPSIHYDVPNAKTKNCDASSE